MQCIKVEILEWTLRPTENKKIKIMIGQNVWLISFVFFFLDSVDATAYHVQRLNETGILYFWTKKGHWLKAKQWSIVIQESLLYQQLFPFRRKRKSSQFQKTGIYACGQINVSYSSGYRLSEKARSIQSISVTAISAVSLEPISIFLILCLAAKGGCLRWPSRSYLS